MNTILTDSEMLAALAYGAGTQSVNGVARAVEAAVLAKLALKAEQEVSPAVSDAYDMLDRFLRNNLDDADYADFSHALDLISTPPAPPQADRQRVPDEFDYKHPKAQALIGADARHRIIIDLVWRILEDPRREFTASDMEYWDTLHDKVQEVALAAAPEAPAQASAVDERATPAVTEFNVGRWCLSEDDCIEQGIDFAAYERGVADAAAAFGRNRARVANGIGGEGKR